MLLIFQHTSSEHQVMSIQNQWTLNTSPVACKKQISEYSGEFPFLRKKFLSVHEQNLSSQQQETYLICQAKPNLLMALSCPMGTNDNSQLRRKKLSECALPGQARLVYTVRTCLVPYPLWGLREGTAGAKHMCPLTPSCCAWKSSSYTLTELQ